MTAQNQLHVPSALDLILQDKKTQNNGQGAFRPAQFVQEGSDGCTSQESPIYAKTEGLLLNLPIAGITDSINCLPRLLFKLVTISSGSCHVEDDEDEGFSSELRRWSSV